jgi:hypothetical protein
LNKNKEGEKTEIKTKINLEKRNGYNWNEAKTIEKPIRIL